jgi:cytochrome c oxidase subunit 4
MMKDAAPTHHGHDDKGGHGHDGHGDGDEYAVHAHISKVPFLVAIFLALIVLTVTTVAVSYVDFGSGNTIVAIVVATLKASLVGLFFMHLRHDKLFHGVIFVMSFVFLGVFLILTLDDRNTRGRVDAFNGVVVDPSTGTAAPGVGIPPAVTNAPPDHGGHGASGSSEHGAGTSGEHAAPATSGEHGAPPAGGEHAPEPAHAH